MYIAACLFSKWTQGVAKVGHFQILHLVALIKIKIKVEIFKSKTGTLWPHRTKARELDQNIYISIQANIHYSR